MTNATLRTLQIHTQRAMTTRPTISVSVKGGRFNVCDVTFAPSGKSTITYIKKGLTASEAIDCLKSL